MRFVGRGGLLVAGEGEVVLLLAADALRLGQELGRDAHHQRALAGAREELGVEVDAGVHRDVVHVLQAADDLHVLGIGQDRVRRLGERLQAAAAQPIDRRPAGLDRQPGHQADRAGDVEPLLALSAACCRARRLRSRAGSMPVRSTSARTTATARSSERTSRNTPFSGMGPANRRAAAIDDDGVFHGLSAEFNHRDTECTEGTEDSYER